MNYINNDKTNQYFDIRKKKLKQNIREEKRLIFHM